MKFHNWRFSINTSLLGNIALLSLQQNNEAIIAHKAVLWQKIAFEVLKLVHSIVSNLTEIPHTSYYILPNEDVIAIF